MILLLVLGALAAVPLGMIAYVTIRDYPYGGTPMLVGDDRYGRLYNVTRWDGTQWKVLEVVDATPTKWGYRKRYRLRAHPNCQTPKAAVAWSFSKPESEYCPEVET